MATRRRDQADNTQRPNRSVRARLRSPEYPLTRDKIPLRKPEQRATALDFWRWAFSDVLLDTTRGPFAEFLVAHMIGEGRHSPPNTTSHDIETSAGTPIEVKSTAYRQRWRTTRSRSPRFSGLKKKPWRVHRSGGNERIVYGKTAYLAKIYVLCLLAEQDCDRLEPFDLAQWEFYVLSRKTLKRITNDGASIGLAKLRNRVERCAAEDLSERVAEIESEFFRRPIRL